MTPRRDIKHRPGQPFSVLPINLGVARGDSSRLAFGDSEVEELAYPPSPSGTVPAS